MTVDNVGRLVHAGTRRPLYPPLLPLDISFLARIVVCCDTSPIVMSPAGSFAIGRRIVEPSHCCLYTRAGMLRFFVLVFSVYCVALGVVGPHERRGWYVGRRENWPSIIYIPEYICYTRSICICMMGVKAQNTSARYLLINIMAMSSDTWDQPNTCDDTIPLSH